jgi:hypothetical protein
MLLLRRRDFRTHSSMTNNTDLTIGTSTTGLRLQLLAHQSSCESSPFVFSPLLFSKILLSHFAFNCCEIRGARSIIGTNYVAHRLTTGIQKSRCAAKFKSISTEPRQNAMRHKFNDTCVQLIGRDKICRMAFCCK